MALTGKPVDRADGRLARPTSEAVLQTSKVSAVVSFKGERG